MRRVRLFFLGILFVFWGNPVIAQELNFGLSMTGAPKYTAQDKTVSYANPDAPKGGTLRRDSIGTFDTLNPYTIKGKSAQGLNLVYDRLMARVWDEPFTLYPLIAERAEIAPDRSAITFYIDPRARFHDGSPITPDDVVYSFETLKEAGRPNMRRIYQLVSTVEKRGENGVHFQLGEGYDQETVMILAMMPVLSKTYWSARTFDRTTLEPPLANGPYRIASIDPGRRIVYERVPDYWAKDLLVNAGHHNFDQIIYDYYRDDSVAFEAFKAGNTDLRVEFDAGKWASAYDFPAAQKGDVRLEALAHGRPERVRALIFNTRREPFDDIRVREALELLLDFEWINTNLFHGQYSRIDSYYPNSALAAKGEPDIRERALLEPWRESLPEAVFGPAYAPPESATREQKRANMKRANELLKAAGWNVENGQRMRGGKPFTFEILLGAPEDEKIALHFKRSLETMGIRPVIRVLDSAAYIGRMNEYDFDMTLYYWQNTLSPGTEQMLYWSCEAAKQPARWNFAGICHPAVDTLAAAVPMARTAEDLQAHVRALDRILTHGHYMIPLYYAGKDFVASWKKLKHPEITPVYGAIFETWWMDQDANANRD